MTVKFRVVVGNLPVVVLPPWWAVPVFWRVPGIFKFYRFRQGYHRQQRKIAYRLSYRRMSFAVDKITATFLF